MFCKNEIFDAGPEASKIYSTTRTDGISFGRYVYFPGGGSLRVVYIVGMMCSGKGV